MRGGRYANYYDRLHPVMVWGVFFLMIAHRTHVGTAAQITISLYFENPKRLVERNDLNGKKCLFRFRHIIIFTYVYRFALNKNLRLSVKY